MKFISNTGSQTETACDTYTWPANSQTYTTSGTYTTTLTNAVNCDSVVTLSLTINETPQNGVTQDGTTLTSDATAAEYQWLDGVEAFAPITGEMGVSFTATEKGKYAVKVSVDGCVDTSACVPITRVGIDGLM